MNGITSTPVSRKKKRKENKKRKLQAYLELVQSNEKDSKSPDPCKKKKTEECEPPKSKKEVSACSYSELKQMKTHINKMKMPWPVIELTAMGLQCQITSENNERLPLTMRDIQNFILNILMPGRFPICPRWIKIICARQISHVVTVAVEGVSIEELKKFAKNKTSIKKAFNSEVINADNGNKYRDSVPDWLLCSLPRTISSLPIALEVLPSSSKPLEDLIFVPSYNAIWNSAVKAVCQSNGGKDSKGCAKTGLTDGPQSSNEDTNSNTETEDKPKDLPASDMFDRRKLLLTPSDLYQFRYPVPFSAVCKDDDFFVSKERYEEVTPSSPMFAIDCEMCLTSSKKNELTSISVVNEDLKVVYHTLVKPKNDIINYLTKYSGITKKMLSNVTTTIDDVHSDLRKLLPPDAILVGHSLNSDLMALKMMHPYVIDSSIVYNLSHIPVVRPSLKCLANLFLNKTIQNSLQGHDPTEDAITSLELIQLKLKKGFSFGNVMEGFSMQVPSMENEALPVPEESILVNGLSGNYSNLFQHVGESKKKAAVIMTSRCARSCEHLLEGIPKEKTEVHILEGNKHLSVRAASVGMSKDFTYVHMKMNKVREKCEKVQKAQLCKLDKRLQRIFRGACQRALVMYIFTGSSESTAEKDSNGLVMLSIKSLDENTSLASFS